MRGLAVPLALVAAAVAAAGAFATAPAPAYQPAVAQCLRGLGGTGRGATREFRPVSNRGFEGYRCDTLTGAAFAALELRRAQRLCLSTTWRTPLGTGKGVRFWTLGPASYGCTTVLVPPQ